MTEPTPLESAQKLLIEAAIGSCTCNTKSPELIWHAPDCRYVKIMMALENVEIAANSPAHISHVRGATSPASGDALARDQSPRE